MFKLRTMIWRIAAKGLISRDTISTPEYASPNYNIKDIAKCQPSMRSILWETHWRGANRDLPGNREMDMRPYHRRRN